MLLSHDSRAVELVSLLCVCVNTVVVVMMSQFSLRRFSCFVNSDGHEF